MHYSGVIRCVGVVVSIAMGHLDIKWTKGVVRICNRYLVQIGCLRQGGHTQQQTGLTETKGTTTKDKESKTDDATQQGVDDKGKQSGGVRKRAGASEEYDWAQ